MNLYKWTAAPDLGCFLRMVEFRKCHTLQSAPMLISGDREDSICDVSTAAFDTPAEQGIFCRKVATLLECSTDAVVESIRG